MKVLQIVVVAMIAAVPAVHAASCYIGGSLGTTSASMTSAEGEAALTSHHVNGITAEVHGRTTPRQAFFGCVTPWWDTSIELMMMDGLTASKHTDVALRGQLFGVDQQVTVKAYGVSVLKSFKNGWVFDPFVRLGVVQATGSYDVDASAVVGGINRNVFQYRKDETQTGPFAGVGLEYRSEKNPLFVRFEEQFFGDKFKATFISVGYRVDF